MIFCSKETSLQRLAAVRQHVPAGGALWIIHEPNVNYLSGYEGHEASLLVTEDNAYLITDFRYTEIAEKQAASCQLLVIARERLPKFVARNVLEMGLTKLAFEQDALSYGDYRALAEDLAGKVELLPLSDAVEPLRMVKDEAEMTLLRHACSCTDKVFDAICGIIKPGMTEMEIANELYYQIGKLGCDSSFDAIIASGPNGSLPHAVPQADKVVKSGEMITLDFGCAFRGYHADMTRTISVGQPSQQMKQIYDIVLESHLAGVAATRPHITGKELDAVCRDIIVAAGYGDNFGHGTGNGIGLEIHEATRVSHTGEIVLKPGHCITIEPGIYLPGIGGVRIEDSVLVTETGGESLFTAPKELIIL